jgi:F-type H+-transporting ATPase subunit a
MAMSVFLTVLCTDSGSTASLLQSVRAKGIPIYILPLIVFIEVLSFLSRPISHSVRLLPICWLVTSR